MNVTDILSPEFAIEQFIKGNYGPAANLVLRLIAQRNANDDRDFARTLILDVIRSSVANEAVLADMNHKDYAKWVCDRADAILAELNRRRDAHIPECRE